MSVAHFLPNSFRLNSKLPQRTCRLNKMSLVWFIGTYHFNWKVLTKSEGDYKDYITEAEGGVTKLSLFFLKANQLQTALYFLYFLLSKGRINVIFPSTLCIACLPLCLSSHTRQRNKTLLQSIHLLPSIWTILT